MIKWINAKRKPKRTDEYLVVWNLKDGHYPVTTSIDYDADTKQWADPRANGIVRSDNKILYWAHLPKAPRGIPAKLYRDNV